MPHDFALSLSEPLDARRIKKRSAGGSRPSLSYLASHDVIRTANRIFGYGRWGYRILDHTVLGAIEVERDGRKGIHVGYKCVVELQVNGCTPTCGVGYGDATEYTATAKITAHELAIKEAESDAVKRALRNFGDQFGLILYASDEERRELWIQGRDAYRQAVADLADTPNEDATPEPSLPLPQAEPYVEDEDEDISEAELVEMIDEASEPDQSVPDEAPVDAPSVAEDTGSEETRRRPEPRCACGHAARSHREGPCKVQGCDCEEFRSVSEQTGETADPSDAGAVPQTPPPASVSPASPNGGNAAFKSDDAKAVLKLMSKFVADGRQDKRKLDVALTNSYGTTDVYSLEWGQLKELREKLETYDRNTSGQL